MNEEQTSYKVTDRRLFNPDGTPRDVPENEKPEPVPAKSEAASAPTSSPEPPAEVNTGSAQDAVPPQATTATAAATAPDAEPDLEVDDAELGAEDPASFASFMMSIASNAA